MAEFKSWRSYREFEWAVMRQARYIRSPEVEEFLQAVLTTAGSRAEDIPSGTLLWRAQLGYGHPRVQPGDESIDDELRPHRPDRMKPLKGRAVEGRANSKGIPHLYLATHRETALAEVRPWVGSLISVAQFKTRRHLRVANCTTNDKRVFYLDEEPSVEERERSVWVDIDTAFSTPVTPDDNVAAYVPTQVIAELLKTHGFDGVAYRSSLGAGHNIVLFDLEVAEIINCTPFDVTSVDFKFSQLSNPYFVNRT